MTMPLPRLSFPKKSKYVTTGAIVFNIIFILAYPVIATFYVAFTALVWLLSLPSNAWTWIAKRIKR